MARHEPLDRLGTGERSESNGAPGIELVGNNNAEKELKPFFSVLYSFGSELKLELKSKEKQTKNKVKISFL